MSRCCEPRRGFTLVELVIVILILGILAGVAAPRVLDSSAEATKNTFITQLFMFADGFDVFAAKNGGYPPGSAAGVLPSGVEAYLSANVFAAETPFGGRWDYTAGAQGQNPSLGAQFIGGVGWPGDATFLEIDQAIDDGNPSTGSFVIVSASNKFVFYRLVPP